MKKLALTLLILTMGLTAGCSDTPADTPTPEPTTTTIETTAEEKPATPGGQPTLPPESTTEQQQLEEARQLYPPYITIELLLGNVPVPPDFDELLTERIGAERLSELRSGATMATGNDNDIAALCLLLLGIPPENLPAVDGPVSPGEPGSSSQGGPIRSPTVTYVDTDYRAAPGNLSGRFSDGQEADIMLSGIDFNNTGGGLLFNHPKSIATDGTHLLLADGNNNRVLIWNNLPTDNIAPDIVLGQPDFNSNNPGAGMDEMNWPVAVATDGRRVLVADTYNHRILIWNDFPTRNGEPADIILGGQANTAPPGSKPDKTITGWPWGVWTDGTKVAVSCTAGGYVLIWNEFPTRDGQPADIYLTGGGDMGTPRSITSDGEHLIVGDHNAQNTGNEIGNFFWSSFPTSDDEPYDFFSPDPSDPYYAWMQGTFTSDGKMIMLGHTLHIWNSFPENASDTPDLSVTGFDFEGGDGGAVATAGDRVYICEYNGNRVSVYNDIPTKATDVPDFTIGSPDIYTNTLETHYFMTNGVPATNGESLFVSSDFDRKLYVWKQLPDESGAHPDLVYELPEAPWDNALWEDTLVLAGKGTVYLWEELPLDGQMPDATYNNGIGDVRFKELNGVAIDDRYFYLSDYGANRVYVWEDIPDIDDSPLFSLEIDGPWRLSSDGEYLAVTSIYNHTIYLYRVDKLSANARPVSLGGPGTLNLPQNAILANGSLFVADTNHNLVYIWENTADAINSKSADVVLGKEITSDIPMIGTDTLFWPAGLAFDGNYLWIGEFKFSCRMLRFSVQ